MGWARPRARSLTGLSALLLWLQAVLSPSWWPEAQQARPAQGSRQTDRDTGTEGAGLPRGEGAPDGGARLELKGPVYTLGF